MQSMLEKHNCKNIFNKKPPVFIQEAFFMWFNLDLRIYKWTGNDQ